MLYRLLFTIATAACLTGLYAVYAVIARPLVVIPDLPPNSIEPRDRALAHRPLENVRVAATYLSELRWAAKSQYTLRSGQTFIYTDEWNHDGNSPWITFMPFAMVWVQKDKDGQEQAISLVSYSASVKFASEFDTINPNPGRVVTAVLHGSVQIKGPNGLAIVGNQFTFDESAPSIVSTNPVQFEYASHKGSGRSLNVKLIPAEGLPGRDRPHVYGIRTIRLKGGNDPNSKDPTAKMHAKLDLRLPPDGTTNREGTTNLVRIRCTEDLEIDVPSQTIVFSKDVIAHRPISRTEYDKLECDKLMLEFASAAKPTPDTAESDAPSTTTTGQESEFQHIPTELIFKRMTATGNKVTVRSTKSHLSGEMERLVYDASLHRLSMSRRSDVYITRKQSRLWVPDVELQLSDDNSALQAVLCKGEGRLEMSNEESNTVALTATWAGFLRMSTDPENGLDLIELQQKAYFSQPGKKTGLIAELIRLWVDPILSTVVSTSGDQERAPAIEPKPKRLVAERNVALISPQLMVDKCGELDVRFEEARIPQASGLRSRDGLKIVGKRELQLEPTDQPGRRGRAVANQSGSARETNPTRQSVESHLTATSHVKEDGLWPPIEIPNSSDSEGDSPGALKLGQNNSKPIELTADRIRVQMQNVEGESQPELVAVDTQGHVEIRQRSALGEPPMTATGDRLILENHGQERQNVHLFGNPAHLHDRRLHVEGREVHLDRGENRVWVQGKGLLQLPVAKGTSIASIEATNDRDLDVHWEESMEFDGRTAKFLGKVSAELGLSKMLCEQMDVHLSTMISFRETVRNREPSLKLIHCRENVAFQSSQYEGTRIIQVVRGRVAEFMHDHELGTSNARGPGEMKFLSRNDKNQTGNQRQQMQSNRPIGPVTSEWNYTRIKFKGRMTGNMKMYGKSEVESQVSTFYDAVDIVHGPVKLMTEEIDSDHLSDEAASMRCEVLELKFHTKGPKNDKPYQQLLGVGNAKIEGQGFYANADEISYDGSKDLYILHARGNQDATISRDSAKGHRDTYSSRRIEFNRKESHIRASNISGAGGP